MPENSDRLTHLDDAGRAHIVDVSEKAVTAREATAASCVRMQAATLKAIVSGDTPKGDVLAVARVAGIQAAKKCSELIPLCHPLALTKVQIEFAELSDTELEVRALCKVTGQTGVEMEALSAVSVAALTVYDMCKAIDKGMSIENIRLLEKTGGKSGAWLRDEQNSNTVEDSIT